MDQVRGRADDDGLRAAQKDAQAFFLDSSLETADGGADFAALPLGEVHCFDDLCAGTSARAEERV